MIKIRIRNDDHEIDLQFPISENKLYAKLAEIHAIEGKDAPQSAFVTEVYWPEEGEPDGGEIAETELMGDVAYETDAGNDG